MPTINGRITLPDGETGMPGNWYAAIADPTLPGPGILGEGAIVRGGTDRFPTDLDGDVTIDLAAGLYDVIYESKYAYAGRRIRLGARVNLTDDLSVGEVLTGDDLGYGGDDLIVTSLGGGIWSIAGSAVTDLGSGIWSIPSTPLGGGVHTIGA